MLVLLCIAFYDSTFLIFFFFQAEDGIRDVAVTGVQTCALPLARVSAPRALGGTGTGNVQGFLFERPPGSPRITGQYILISYNLYLTIYGCKGFLLLLIFISRNYYFLGIHFN